MNGNNSLRGREEERPPVCRRFILLIFLILVHMIGDLANYFI